jgi:hypothetical protein
MQDGQPVQDPVIAIRVTVSLLVRRGYGRTDRAVARKQHDLARG